jgi:hypothetical protein
MEWVLAGVAVWALLAVCLGVVLGRSAHDAEATELGPLPEPSTGERQAAEDPDRQVG